jgi:SAM-dependent methyltransferase
VTHATCLLCGAPVAVPPNASTFSWRTFEYRYARCRACRSLTIDPLPAADVLDSVYGPQYADLVQDPYTVASTKDLAWVLGKLRDRDRPGVFLDYGCGDGELLREVAGLGWKAVGIEYSEAVARSTSAATGLEIASADAADALPAADVVHFGDVIEHLTDPLGAVAACLGLLAPDAVVLAQGPLEMGPSLFSAVVRPGLGGGRSEVIPTHLVQATSLGQRLFFVRAGLTQLEFSTSEVDWPAPSSLQPTELRHPRTVALFALRRLSRAVDALVPSWGNRYRYEGRPPR